MSIAPAAADRPFQRWRQPLLAALVTTALGGSAYFAGWAWPLMFPKPVFVAEAPAGCDLSASACTAVLDASRFIRAQVAPGTRQAGRPMRLLVETGGFTPAAMSVELTGKDMNMGLVTTGLLDTGGGTFAGDATLPVCVRGRMVWQATLIATAPEAVYRAVFHLGVGGS